MQVPRGRSSISAVRTTADETKHVRSSAKEKLYIMLSSNTTDRRKIKAQADLWLDEVHVQHQHGKSTKNSTASLYQACTVTHGRSYNDLTKILKAFGATKILHIYELVQARLDYTFPAVRDPQIWKKKGWCHAVIDLSKNQGESADAEFSMKKTQFADHNSQRPRRSLTSKLFSQRSLQL